MDLTYGFSVVPKIIPLVLYTRIEFKIELLHVSGGNGGTYYLTFKKKKFKLHIGTGVQGSYPFPSKGREWIFYIIEEKNPPFLLCHFLRLPLRQGKDEEVLIGCHYNKVLSPGSSSGGAFFLSFVS